MSKHFPVESFLLKRSDESFHLGCSTLAARYTILIERIIFELKILIEIWTNFRFSCDSNILSRHGVTCRCQKINFNDSKSGITQSFNDVMEFHLSLLPRVKKRNSITDFLDVCLLCAFSIPTRTLEKIFSPQAFCVTWIHTQRCNCADRSRRCCCHTDSLSRSLRDHFCESLAGEKLVEFPVLSAIIIGALSTISLAARKNSTSKSGSISCLLESSNCQRNSQSNVSP